MKNSLPVQRISDEKLAPIKTQARSCTILPDFVDMVFKVHNGRDYVDVLITMDMVGHKLGEFAPYVQISLRGKGQSAV